MHRKPAPWKKSRTYGDIYGGRRWRKLADNIFMRYHTLHRPGINDQLPIVIEDNPSRDFFFPLSISETTTALQALPDHDHRAITHIWLRRLKSDDYVNGEHPFACFICGSGVRLIVLYPFPKDMTLSYGRKRPPNKVINEAEKFGARVSSTGGTWTSKWSLHGLRQFYIQGLLYHAVGRHIDWYKRHWSKANRKQTDDFADQYAVAKTATTMHVFNRLEESKSP